MKPTEPLPLHHSWPLFERGLRFDLGCVFDPIAAGSSTTADAVLRESARIGSWACDLSDNRLVWSDEVYDLFGFPRSTVIDRVATVGLYEEGSRAAMERLRAYAIKHRRGFTLDAQIRPVTGGTRWMRLVAAPVCVGERVMWLQGMKQDVTAEYG